jgi:TRAP-type mannitol/chloroaromatic compound transport system permease small subunit
MPVKVLKPIFDVVDRVSIRLGKGVSWMLVVLILALTYDTFMRYLFSKPTVWAFDMAYMLGGTIMLMGMAWVTTRREQVRVDILYTRFSQKTRTIIDTVFNLVLFFPLYLMLLQKAIPRAIYSYTNKEFSEVGFWRPLMWPYRWMMVVALLMWVLAALVWVIKDLHRLRKGEEL